MTDTKQCPVVRLEDELKNSYLTYAMSVIVSRALPDVRDGMKPSQRRILLAMNDLNLGPSSKFRKCAKIAGDTSGNYHPHGEAVVYPTLVRMAQNFNMRYPLIQGQGNFGSIDGDPPAAMRYTEARLTAPSVNMLEDMDKDTVDFVSNYDETREEPTVLPAKFPNLLVNGSVGIAVGMSTSIPPNNLTEICDGIIELIENPDIEVEALCEIIKGPDFPTGAIICGEKDVRKAYTTGRGIVKVRSKAEVEEKKNGRESIVFKEIPYQLNKAKVIEKIADLVKDGKITGISDVRDESGRKEPVRIVVDLKRGENSDVILNQLYKYTLLQSSFSIIMLALVNGRPQLLNIKEMIYHFVEHRKEIIRRRTLFLLKKAEKRHHIVKGLILALNHIDEVIKVIRGSQDTKEAKSSLREKWQLSVQQADAIVQMRLGALTNLEFNKLDDERKTLEEQIATFKGILEDPQKILAIIKEETIAIRDKYGDKRRTKIGTAIEAFVLEDIIADDQSVVLITHEGYIKRTPVDTYSKQHRGGKGVTGTGMKQGDIVKDFFIASAHQYILFFSNYGKVYWLKVYDIPEMSRTAKGRALVNLLNLDNDENISSVIPVREFDSRWLVMATRQGIIKKTALSAFSRPNKSGIRAINLDEGDRLISTVLTDGEQDLIIGTKLGRACRFNETEVRPLGRAARGVRGCKLLENDIVIGMVVVRDDHSLLTICEKGYGKRSAYESYRLTRRGVQGVLNFRRTDKTGDVVAIVSVRDEEQVMIITSKGMVIRMGTASLRILSRATQGVRLIRLKKNDSVVSVAKLTKEILEDMGEDSSVTEASETEAEADNGEVANEETSEKSSEESSEEPSEETAVESTESE
ncbi:DNA gyrase subunit A [Candidatus Uabimicrobium amorphum]|uniref:DNA gyrase subunit A n=1 Tax=Uabimicrobium amorphum TaxID=2596890 RepID=A0A5S9IRD9_UABAM|nr:DNA gyrase subunit A [Candidatus Uabimicrobium amorphum]BBM86051.1 DNA gyrase subunit A [Candidatus Uabimicrobium amorphum]